MAEYLVQDTSLAAVADPIRTLSGTSETLSLNAMATKITDANNNIDSQANIITQIQSVLGGEPINGGSGSTGESGSGKNTITIKIDSDSYTYPYWAYIAADGTFNKIGSSTTIEALGGALLRLGSNAASVSVVSGNAYIMSGISSDASLHDGYYQQYCMVIVTENNTLLRLRIGSQGSN